jgi:hypothetical protein
MVRLCRSGSKTFIRPLIFGFITVGVSVVLMKSFDTFYSYHNAYGVFWPGAGDWQKWFLIGRFVLKALTDVLWGGTWFLALFFLIAQWEKWIRAEIGPLVQFIILYIIFYFFIFAVSVLQLEWLLKVSFDRLLYLLAPLVIFVTFYVVGEKGQV